MKFQKMTLTVPDAKGFNATYEGDIRDAGISHSPNALMELEITLKTWNPPVRGHDEPTVIIDLIELSGWVYYVPHIKDLRVEINCREGGRVEYLVRIRYIIERTFRSMPQAETFLMQHLIDPKSVKPEWGPEWYSSYSNSAEGNHKRF